MLPITLDGKGSILVVSGKDMVTNEGVRTRTGQQKIEDILREQDYIGWSCDTDGLPHQALYWEVLGFRRGRDQPRTNWRGTAKKNLQKLGLAWEEVEAVVLDRQEWRRSVALCSHAHWLNQGNRIAHHIS